jgi:hypothetical protein
MPKIYEYDSLFFHYHGHFKVFHLYIVDDPNREIKKKKEEKSQSLTTML